MTVISKMVNKHPRSINNYRQWRARQIRYLQGVLLRDRYNKWAINEVIRLKHEIHNEFQERKRPWYLNKYQIQQKRKKVIYYK